MAHSKYCSTVETDTYSSWAVCTIQHILLLIASYYCRLLHHAAAIVRRHSKGNLYRVLILAQLSMSTLQHSQCRLVPPLQHRTIATIPAGERRK